MAKKPKLGSGTRFKQLKGKLAAKGATNPGALAAYIGRKKYGTEKFSKLSAGGKKRKRMTIAEDKAYDKAHGIKAGSKKDMMMDKKHGVMPRKRKRSASAPSGSRNPFGTLKTDKKANAGSVMYPNVLSKVSNQNKLDTGRSLLKKAMRRLRQHG